MNTKAKITNLGENSRVEITDLAPPAGSARPQTARLSHRANRGAGEQQCAK